MSRIALDRLLVRAGRRAVGPIHASFGPGVHGVTSAELDDLALLEAGLTGAAACEGALRFEAPGARLLALGDLLPLPSGHGVRAFARAALGARGEAAVARAGVEGGVLTDRLAPHEAFALALALAEELPDVGAVLVPSPHTLLAPQEDRASARRLRALAACGVPVLVLLAPGLEPARWVDDLVTIDADGRASEPRSVATLARHVRAVTVRGEGLERMAARIVQRGFELAIDPRGRELTIRTPLGTELERAVTEAVAAHDGVIDEVVPCG